MLDYKYIYVEFLVENYICIAYIELDCSECFERHKDGQIVTLVDVSLLHSHLTSRRCAFVPFDVCVQSQLHFGFTSASLVEINKVSSQGHLPFPVVFASLYQLFNTCYHVHVDRAIL